MQCLNTPTPEKNLKFLLVSTLLQFLFLWLAESRLGASFATFLTFMNLHFFYAVCFKMHLFLVTFSIKNIFCFWDGFKMEDKSPVENLLPWPLKKKKKSHSGSAAGLSPSYLCTAFVEHDCNWFLGTWSSQQKLQLSSSGLNFPFHGRREVCLGRLNHIPHNEREATEILW